MHGQIRLCLLTEKKNLYLIMHNQKLENIFIEIVYCLPG